MFLFIRNSFLKTLCFAACLNSLPALAEQNNVAQSDESVQSALFQPSGMIKKQVEFWKLIFTKYGKNHAVFHHRSYPHIVYSVLDFSEFESVYSGKKLSAMRDKALDEETKRIRGSLLWLADGNGPRNPFERRLVKLFSDIKGSSKYKEAADLDQVRSQTGIRERFKEGLIRSGRYLRAMEKVFQEEGLPPELTRIPLIESSFDYSAYSSVGAAGIWQFMRRTGGKYMRVGTVVDERKDPIVSTRAAAKYLTHAFEVLGRWPLAVTSYNHGISGVLRGAKDVGSYDLNDIILRYDGSTWGFASQNFYAEFLAALEIEKNKERYFPGIAVERPVHFDEVELARPMGIYDISRASGHPVDMIQSMNPALLSPTVKGRARIPAGYLVKLPVSAQSVSARKNPAKTRDSRPLEVAGIGPIVYSEGQSIIRQGGTKTSGTVFADVRADDKKKKTVTASDSLKSNKRLVMFRDQNSDKPGKNRSGRSGKSKHKVRQGDTLSQIARQNKLTVAQLMQVNPGLGKNLKPGQTINLE